MPDPVAKLSTRSSIQKPSNSTSKVFATTFDPSSLFLRDFFYIKPSGVVSRTSSFSMWSVPPLLTSLRRLLRLHSLDSIEHVRHESECRVEIGVVVGRVRALVSLTKKPLKRFLATLCAQSNRSKRADDLIVGDFVAQVLDARDVPLGIRRVDSLESVRCELLF